MSRSSSVRTARRVSAMLSPVSPSATGKTLRSLTSCRRASRCASPAATTARKRARFVSYATPAVARLERLGDLAGLEAAGADVRPRRLAVVEDPDLLQVRVEAPLRGDHGVAAAVPERGALAAHVTDLGHEAG